MRFIKQQNGTYRAVIDGSNVVIRPEHGGWQVVIDSIEIEWFLASDLLKAKAFAKDRAAR